MKYYILLIINLLFFVSYTNANCQDIHHRLSLESGGMNLNENDISEGHKSYFRGELTGSVENLRSKLSLSVDALVRGEPQDEDPELLNYTVGAETKYHLKLNEFLHPYLGIRFDHYDRGNNEKWQDTEMQIDFFSATGGLSLQYKWLFANIGTNIPFYTNTKSGNFGPDLFIGFKYNNFDIGYRFKQVVFTDHHFQSGNNDLKFYFSGCQIGYSF